MKRNGLKYAANALPAFLIGLALSTPLQAQEFGLIWLQNCLADAEQSADIDIGVLGCAQNVFFVCKYANAPKTCLGEVVGWMDEERKQYLGMTPAKFGETKTDQQIYAVRRDLIRKGPAPDSCPGELPEFPGCYATSMAVRFHYAHKMQRDVTGE